MNSSQPSNKQDETPERIRNLNRYALLSNVAAMKRSLAEISQQELDNSGALVMAVIAESNEIFDVLMAVGASPNTVLINTKYTPLMAAVSKGKIDVVHKLLRAGADVHFQDKDGHTALECAEKMIKDGTAGKNGQRIVDVLRDKTYPALKQKNLRHYIKGKRPKF